MTSDRCAQCATEKGQTYDWPDNPAYCSRHVLEIVNECYKIDPDPASRAGQGQTDVC